MKTSRIWLLVLLAVLLPVRGALVAAMLCPMMAPPSTSTTLSDPHAAMGHAMPQAADRAQMNHDEPFGAHHAHGDSTGSADTCNLCCDFCSVTRLASSLPALAPAQQHSTLSFSVLSAQAPSFVSDGQERPPRST